MQAKIVSILSVLFLLFSAWFIVDCATQPAFAGGSTRHAPADATFAPESGPTAQTPAIDNGLGDRIHAVTEDVAAKLRALQERLANRPSTVNPGQWDSALEASDELLSKVDALIQLRGDVIALTGDLTKSGASARTKLAQLLDTFEQLADEAENELSGKGDQEALPQALLDAIAREAGAHRAAAKVCELAIKSYAEMLQQNQNGIKTVVRSGPMLTRMRVAAIAFKDLAAAGNDLDSLRETLASFSDRLNLAIQQLELLSQSTESAVRKMTPPAAPNGNLGTTG